MTVITIYSVLETVLCLMQLFSQLDRDAPFTIVFQAAGMNWAKYIVALGALMGMTRVLLAIIIGQALYFTHISRIHLAPPILAVIHKNYGTPMDATIIMTAANCLVAFFTSLDILANLLLISMLFIFSLVDIRLLVRRYYATGETSFLATHGLQLMVKQARKPKLWGVQLVPWLPLASVGINVFIMCSIDGASFLRFLGWSSLLLVYYLLIGLHASYNASKDGMKVRVTSGVSMTSEAMEQGEITPARK
ncbi:Amino acid/polyamine transporter I [Artemisia annua]|uniref:Amino acid/polyamine transporter I n=1 Tax=Artemisia annua TaxID=35608 RepID=A0A2U1L1P2_ARTAN|nr:Amino acid/polyamine transporter I [Artemisia annua]